MDKLIKLAIVGSRTITDIKFLNGAIIMHLKNKIISEIISGGAKGVDSLAEQYAKEKNIPITIFLPDWDQHGKKAGYLRNIQIAKYSDVILAIWDGKSKGTEHTINLAKKHNKIVYVSTVYFTNNTRKVGET